MGAMTGGGFGKCAGGAGNGGTGRGRGAGNRGRGRGTGRGLGRGFGGGAYAAGLAAPATPEEEKALLESQLDRLEQETIRVREHLESLKS